MSEEIKADYCIVGGGIAGAVLAAKLAASGKKILILEQGPTFTEADRLSMLRESVKTLNDYADYNDNTPSDSITPQTSATDGDQVVEWSAQRLFGVGGTALHFEGLMGRPLEEDMQVSTLYCYSRDWPIAYSELEPWLLRAENEIGIACNIDNPYASPRSGPFPMPGHDFSYFDREIFAPALKQLGIVGHSCPRAINSVPYGGRSQCMACRACKFCPSGARYSPDRVHIPIIEKLPNVEILKNVSVQRLETSAGGNSIIAAHLIRTQDREPLVVLADKFILAMGGVATPRMLMLSADGNTHREGLGNMGGQLGQSFSDHVHPYVTINLGKPAGNRLGFETMITDYYRAQEGRSEHPTFTLFGSPAIDWFPIGNEAAEWSVADETLSLEHLRESIPNIVTLSGMCELGGNGTIELDDENTDAFGSPVAKVTMKLSEWDRRGPGKFAEAAYEIAEVMGVADISPNTPPEFGLGYHPSGATAMANTPDEGVCNSNLRVFGVDNLYIVSNSVFPHMGANPPTLTIVALALRLGEHLEGRPV